MPGASPICGAVCGVDRTLKIRPRNAYAIGQYDAPPAESGKRSTILSCHPLRRGKFARIRNARSTLRRVAEWTTNESSALMASRFTSRRIRSIAPAPSAAVIARLTPASPSKAQESGAHSCALHSARPHRHGPRQHEVPSGTCASVGRSRRWREAAHARSGHLRDRADSALLERAHRPHDPHRP